MIVPGSINPLLLTSAAAAGGFQVSRSLRFNSADSAYLDRTPSVAGNRKTWTWSGWVKRSVINLSGANNSMFSAASASSGSSDYCDLRLEGDSIQFDLDTSSTVRRQLTTVAVFRDPSAWYHVVCAMDSDNATAASRLRIWVNNQEQTLSTTLDSGVQGPINNTVAHRIGGRVDGSDIYFSGYLANIQFIDGQALTPSSFTEVSATTGQLIPKAYSGTYGTNGFYLQFADNSSNTASTLGKDTSGNGNNWTPNNLSVTAGAGNDSLVDTPTSYGTDTGVGGSVRGNYCTWNPLNAQLGAGSVSNGNLDFTGPSGSANYNFIGGTFAIDTSSTSGWYFEFAQTTYGNGAMVSLLDTGFQASALSNQSAIGYSGTNSTAGISYANEGSIHNYGSTTSGLTSWTSSGDIISIAIKNNKIWFAKNGTWISGSPSAETSPSITLASTKYVTPAAGGINSSVISLNTGQRPFAYTAPSGFKALCDTNLPAPVVAKPNTLMDVALYTGNSSVRSITGFNFSPDFVWIKPRSVATQHNLYDAVRGATKALFSDFTDAEATVSNGLTAFNSDGFSLGSNQYVNDNAVTFVAWAWDAGTSTVSNTQGSITSQVRANASAGFSVVTYTANAPNNTIGHGLGIRPEFVITKARTRNDNWLVYHSALGVDKWLHLNITAAAINTSGIWGTSGNWTSNTFGVSTNGVEGNNYGSNDFVAYCFAPVVGYSAALSWTGNGSNDGPMLYCGFTPRFFIAKRTDSANDWWMWDTARSNTGNPVDEWLSPNRSDAEYANDADFDFLSNGVKIRTNSSTVNASAGSYIGFAWAENPFQYARAR